MFKNVKHSKSNGYTLVEILIVIVIMAVLVTILTLALFGQQQKSRDTARNSKTTVISEALEKYYTKNGEYPSVTSLINKSTSDVKQKLNINDGDILVFPRSAGTNSSIVGVSSTPSPTQLVYQGTPENSACQTDPIGYCKGYELKYKTEADDALVTVKSRHNAFVAADNGCTSNCATKPNTPSVIGSLANASTIRFTASGTTCTTGTVQYQIRYNTSVASESSMPDWGTNGSSDWLNMDYFDVSKSNNENFYSQSRARCAVGGTTSDNSVIDSKTFANPPACVNASNPTNLTVSSPTTSSLQLNWNASSSGTSPITYYIYGGTNPSSPGYYYATGATSGAVTGLSPNTTYYFVIYAANTCGGFTGTSSTVSGTTTSSAPTCTNPSTPTSLYTSSPTTSSLQINWNGASGTTPITYYVYYGTNSGSLTSTWTTSSTSATITGLSPGTTYYFQVYSGNCAGYSGASSMTSGSTSAGGSQPASPNVNATATSSSTITVSWPNVSGATSYSVSGTNASCSSSPCYVSGLNPSTTYTYYVTAYNSYGQARANDSATTQASVPQCTPPSAPSLSASPSSATSIIAYTGHSSSGTSPISYKLEYGNSTSYGSTINSPSSSESIGGRYKNTTYYFRMVASNNCGSSYATSSAKTYSDINLVAQSPMNVGGRVPMSWSGANLPASTSYVINNTSESPSRGSCSASGGSFCGVDISDCSGGAGGLTFTINGAYGGTGSAYSSWPGRPSVGLNSTNEYSNSIRLYWHSSGNSYHQIRYKKIGGSYYGINSLSPSANSYLFSGLDGNSTYNLLVAASNCRYRRCDLDNSYCEGVTYPNAPLINVNRNTH